MIPCSTPPPLLTPNTQPYHLCGQSSSPQCRRRSKAAGTSGTAWCCWLCTDQPMEPLAYGQTPQCLPHLLYRPVDDIKIDVNLITNHNQYQNNHQLYGIKVICSELFSCILNCFSFNQSKSLKSNLNWKTILILQNTESGGHFKILFNELPISIPLPVS